MVLSIDPAASHHLYLVSARTKHVHNQLIIILHRSERYFDCEIFFFNALFTNRNETC